MNGSQVTSERLVALFVLAIVLLNPPFLLIFDRVSITAGIPVLYLYLFAAWAVLIVILALISEGSKPSSQDGDKRETQASESTPENSGEVG